MADVFLQVLLDNLTMLIKDKVGRILGVDTEMKKLSSALTKIQAELKYAEVKQLESEPSKDYLRKLNDLIYEIDDCLDECAVLNKKPKYGKLSSYSPKNILYRHKIGKRMREVTENLDNVAAEQKFHVHEKAVESPSKLSDARDTGSLLSESHHVCGRDVEKEKIVKILVEQVRDELSIILEFFCNV